MAPVIIFGPTGHVGSNVARTCIDLGAEVVLAMRDVNKPIPGLSKVLESSAHCIRVKVDLGDLDSVANAVSSSGAKRAFIYLHYGSTDHMRSTLEAIKSAGIEFVVFLSSCTIRDRPLASIDSSEHIPHVHAQVEISLMQVFGPDKHVAIRPGSFATNMLQWKTGISKGNVDLFAGHVKHDCVTPEDMGQVSGTVLVYGPKNNQRHVYLYGPKVYSRHDAILEIGRTLGHEVKIKTMADEEQLADYHGRGTPSSLAQYLTRVFGSYRTDTPFESRYVRYDEGLNNIRLYTGRSPTTLQEWVREHKEVFIAE